MIRVAIIGSTGSIGRSALEIVRRHPDRFRVEVLTAHRSSDLLADQVREFRPAFAVLADPESANHDPRAGRGAADPARSDLPDAEGATEWAFGADAVVEAAGHGTVDVVVNALVGAAGLGATLRALETGKRLALANKESLVAGGDLVMRARDAGGGELVPIDSEHSAILQCLAGARREEIGRIVLTASGGPFRGRSREELARVGPREALRHPTWSMGAKISVDSATLANKALEVVEAHFLYGLPYEAIDAVVHPQSIVHSFVEFTDGSVIAQMGDPTMELPILYALSHPRRVPDPALRSFDPVRWGSLEFEEIDHDVFRMYGLGVEAGRIGGTAPAVFNAANEVAVQGFLDERLGFLEMAEVVEATLDSLGSGVAESLEELLTWDEDARNTAEAAISRRHG
jgi:1-deoxy-D-xylulose-5-phosphate reductoisomerase